MKLTKATKLLLATATLTTAAFSSPAALSYLDIGYYGGNTFNISAQGTTHNGTIASAFSATRTGGDPLPNGHPNPFITFCLSLNATLSQGYWQSGSFSDALATDSGAPVRQGVASLQYAAQLYETYAGGNSSGFSGVIMPSGGWGSATSAQKAEGSALQLAIWEVLYEYHSTGAFDVMSGSGFGITSSANPITTRANAMLGSLTWDSPDTSLSTTFWNAANLDGSSRGSQDLIGPLAPVPEPTTIIAGALLLLPFFASTLRIRRKHTV